MCIGEFVVEDVGVVFGEFIDVLVIDCFVVM